MAAYRKPIQHQIREGRSSNYCDMRRNMARAKMLCSIVLLNNTSSAAKGRAQVRKALMGM